MKEIKEICLGDIRMSRWEPGDDLYPEWMKDEKEDNEFYININPDEIILFKGKYFLLITYPLSKPYKETFEVSESGISRKDFVKLVVDAYHKIYDAEDNTTNIKADLIPGMYNRNTTDGKYGIWGHELSDLILHTLYIDENNLLTLGIDS